RLAMRRFVLVALSLLILAPTARAQPPGALAGTVRTSDGSPVPHVVLLLRGPAGTVTLVTGPEGRYRAAALSPGRYSISLRAPGFRLAGTPAAELRPAETSLHRPPEPAPVRGQIVVARTRGRAAS